MTLPTTIRLPKSVPYIAIIAILLLILVFQQSRFSAARKINQEKIEQLTETNKTIEKSIQEKNKQIVKLKEDIITAEQQREKITIEKTIIKKEYENKISNINDMSAWEIDNFFSDRLPKNN